MFKKHVEGETDTYYPVDFPSIEKVEYRIFSLPNGYDSLALALKIGVKLTTKSGDVYSNSINISFDTLCELLKSQGFNYA